VDDVRESVPRLSEHSNVIDLSTPSVLVSDRSHTQDDLTGNPCLSMVSMLLNCLGWYHCLNAMNWAGQVSRYTVSMQRAWSDGAKNALRESSRGVTMGT